MQVSTPLAEILRPKNLDDYLGQEHLTAKGAILRQAVESGKIPSMILWGPPGVGKTTLAYIIAQSLDKAFFSLSAINSGVREIREIITQARSDGQGAILFIDEIHRFSKSQQDSLLGAVEKGIITLIGATTENPSFEVISPLLSRCQVYILKPLEEKELLTLLNKGVKYLEKSLNKTIQLIETEALMYISGGDARKLLNALELTVHLQTGTDTLTLTNELVYQSVQQNLLKYDKGGEMHYDIISAFIKSLRGSDPNGAVYWLARMISAGEDPLFIARRMVILASEDIGNANPNALLLANACFEAVNKVGMPEGRIILSQTAVYLATSVKSNSTYLAIEKALALAEAHADLPVPLHLRNAPTKLMKNMGYGKNYQYAHDFDNNFSEQEYLPDKITGTKFYEPGNNPREKETRNWLKILWKQKYRY